MQTPIKTAYKTLLLALVTVLMGLVSSGARADAPTFNTTVNGTNYDFTYITGSFTDNSVLLQSQPWWGSASYTELFAGAVGANLGLPSIGDVGPLFAYSNISVSHISVGYYTDGTAYSDGINSNNQSFPYAVATVHSSGAAPEMNASHIPQVGLLLGCLFFLTGRKKEVVEPMLAA